MRKRTLISCFLTIILLLVTSQYWITSKTTTGVGFDFYLFVIITICGYLILYKITDCLADLKSVENKSRIDIIFLTVFFILLFIPMSHISDKKTTKAENRMLAVWKPIINSKKEINYNFGKDFDNWYNDRFFLRDKIVKTYNLMRYNLAINYYENSKGFVNKKNNWMSKKVVFNNDNIVQKENDLIIKNIKNLQSYCAKNDIKCYIIIAPRKEEICSKELYPMLGNMTKYNKTGSIIKEVKEKTNFEIVYPYKQVQELQKTNYAYFKTDHHWTDEAAHIGYLQVMKFVKKDFPNIQISQKSDFENIYSNMVRVVPSVGFFEGITCRNLNIHDKRLLDVKYKYLKYKNADNIEYSFEDYSKENYHIYTYKNKINAPDMILFGDSFTLNLLPAITSSFRNTTNIYTYVTKPETMKKVFKINRFKKVFSERKPKVLIICLSEIIRLQYLFEEDK